MHGIHSLRREEQPGPKKILFGFLFVLLALAGLFVIGTFFYLIAHHAVQFAFHIANSISWRPF